MSIIIKIEKNHIYIITALAVLVLGAVFAQAFGSSNPTLHGHDTGELQAGTLQGNFTFTDKIGIGRSPVANIHINGTGDQLRMERAGFDSFGFVQSPGVGIGFTDFTDGRLEMFFNGAGALGIKSVNPLAALHVNGSAGDNEFMIESPAGEEATMSFLGAGTSKWQIGKSNDGSSLFFFSFDASATVMSILNDSEVGIGTVAPDSPLDVEGAIRTENAGIYHETTGSAAQTCDTLCANTDNTHTFNTDTGACLQAWGFASGTPISCAATDAGGVACLCAGYSV